MTFKELRQASGMNQTQFSKYFEIPYRTIQDWEHEKRKCPEYLLKLMEYRVKNEDFENRLQNVDQKAVVRKRNEDMRELGKIYDLNQKERMESITKRSYFKCENGRAKKEEPNNAQWVQSSALCNPYCSNCKNYNNKKTPYCPYCGKEMA